MGAINRGSMRAIVIVGGAEDATLELATLPVPKVGDRQLLVRVHAAGVNRADLRRTQAHFKVGGPIVAGLEIAGEVTALGPGCSEYAVGDRVMAMAGGAYAEYAVVDEAAALPIPKSVSWVDAAALPTWYQTAHDALVSAGGFTSGQSVLITAATSGVAIAVAQCARLLGASTIIGSIRGDDHGAKLKELAFSELVSHGPEDIRSGIARLTDGRGVDLVVDFVGSGLLDALLDSTAVGGRIVSVGRLAGFQDTLDLDKLAYRRVSIVGVTFRTRTPEDKRAVRDAMMRDLWGDLSAGRLAPVVDSTFSLEDALAAQERMQRNVHFGKIVLTVA